MPLDAKLALPANAPFTSTTKTLAASAVSPCEARRSETDSDVGPAPLSRIESVPALSRACYSYSSRLRVAVRRADPGARRRHSLRGLQHIGGSGAAIIPHRLGRRRDD